eukprot:276187-Pelagomonas_calceolata.AAC.5
MHTCASAAPRSAAMTMPGDRPCVQALRGPRAKVLLGMVPIGEGGLGADLVWPSCCWFDVGAQVPHLLPVAVLSMPLLGTMGLHGCYGVLIDLVSSSSFCSGAWVGVGRDAPCAACSSAPHGYIGADEPARQHWCFETVRSARLVTLPGVSAGAVLGGPGDSAGSVPGGPGAVLGGQGDSAGAVLGGPGDSAGSVPGGPVLDTHRDSTRHAYIEADTRVYFGIKLVVELWWSRWRQECPPCATSGGAGGMQARAANFLH